MKKKKMSELLFNALNHTVFVVITLIVLVPLLLVVLSSFKTPEQISQGYHLSLPAPFSLDNYKEVFKNGNVLTGFKNSMLLVLGTITVNVILSSMVAYSLSRFEFKLKKVYFFFKIYWKVIFSLILPATATLIILKSVDVLNDMFTPYLSIIMYLIFKKKILSGIVAGAVKE